MITLENTKKIEKNFSVYIHISPSGKRYIGITSIKPTDRWGSKGQRYKRNPYFQNAILKYGWENFQHLIVANKLGKDEAKKMEIALISKYKANDRKYGYNRTLGGDLKDEILSDNERKKRRIAAQKKWDNANPNRIKALRKKYDCTDYRRTYHNTLNKTPKRREHRTEYMRKYREENRFEYNQRRRRTAARKRIQNPPKDYRKPVVVNDKSGSLIFVGASIKETAEKLNLSDGFVQCCLKGKRNSKLYDFTYAKVGENGNDN